MNTPLTSTEAVDYLYHAIERYIAKGVCEICAITLASSTYGIEYKKAAVLWSDRKPDG